jgi:hypothetical protein
MKRSEAIKELKHNINCNFSHAVLLCDSKGSWRTELHPGHAGNCCCDEHKDFVWRETSPYTDPSEIDDITETSQSFSAAALGRKGGLAKSERKTAAVRENAKKGGRPRKTKEEGGKEMMYFLRGTVANGEIIFQNGWEWANDLTLNGPASNENEVGSCVPNANGYWEHRGFRQIIAKEAESILADAGYLEMPEEWFPQERKD